MHIHNILSTLNLSHSFSNLLLDEDYIDVDIYEAGTDILDRIIYISDTLIPIPLDNLILYTTPVKDTQNRHIILQDTDKWECYSKLHRFFLRNNHYQHEMLELLDYDNISTDANRLKEIIRRGAYFLNNPIILTNSSYKVLAIEDLGERVDDPIFDNALKFGYCSSDAVFSFEKENVTTKVLSEPKAFRLDTGLAEKIPRVLSKIMIKDKVVAYIGILERNRKMDAEDLEHVEILCRFIKNEMEKDNALLEGINIIYESIILDLLHKNIHQNLVLKERLHASRWNTKKYFRCGVIPVNTKGKKFLNAPYVINKWIMALNIKIIFFESCILILFNYDMRAEFLNQLNYLKQQLQKIQLKMGISNEFKDLLMLHQYYQEASKIISLANLSEKDEWILDIDHILPYYLISMLPMEQLYTCMSSLYMSLYEYDKSHGTAFVDTLCSYIKNNCDINRSAKELFIHRNTMAHRLERIENIAGISLQDGNLLMNFWIYVHLKKYLLYMNNK